MKHMIGVLLALTAGSLMAPADVAKIECGKTPCESIRQKETPKSNVETAIEPYNDMVARGANRARQAKPTTQMACCSEPLGINRRSETYSQRLDDVLLVFFFWLSVSACLFALAVIVVLGVNVYTLTKGAPQHQRAAVVSIAVLRETRGHPSQLL